MMSALLIVASLAQLPLPPAGRIVDKVICQNAPGQTYALYLPSVYRSDRKWPILYAFDPAARGRLPVERFLEAAEKYGYIVAGSNNSRNGPWKISEDALQAVWDDTHSRFSLDPRRVYVTGFSGGARVASAMGMAVPDVAGVIACGAGFSQGAVPKKVPFAFFGIAGTEDFNYIELQQAHRELDAQGVPNRFAEFDGGHGWCPTPLCTAAVEWMELMAMKSGRRPVDRELVDTLFDQAFSLLHHLESGGNLPALYRAYATVSTDFQGLKIVSDFAKRAVQLKDSKEIRETLKREREMEERQARLSAELQRVMADSPSNVDNMLADLRKTAEGNEDTPERRVARRVLGSYNVALREKRNAATETQRKD